MTRKALEAHAIACRAAAAAGLTRPTWTGGRLAGADLRWTNLTGADLRWADLTGANLWWADLAGADLAGADLDGALLTEGTARGCAISGRAGGYRWWAVLMDGGDILLQYGCERRLLSEWRLQGPELSVHHGHPAEFWAEGPMVAIAAAEALAGGTP